MTDLHASPETLQGWASQLNGASEDLTAAGRNAPEPPNAGRCSAVVAAGLSQLCDAMAAVTDGITASGQAIDASGTTYTTSDTDGANEIDKVGGN